MLSGLHLTPGVGIDFGALGEDPARARRRLRRQLGVQLGAGLHHGRRHPADRLPAAPGRRREARPAAAQVLRQPSPGRRPEPGHQRHRQHRPDAPAEPDPAHHGAAHRPRRAADDAPDQSPAGARLDPGGAHGDRHHGPHRGALAEAVRRPVGVDRHAQRPGRGDAHRPRHRQGLRPPGRGRGAVRRGEREAVRGQLPGPVHLRDHPAVDELRGQPELRRDRRHRRAAGGRRPAVAGRRHRVHPVLAPVHLPDHPDGQHRQRPAVGGGLGRAGLRAARRGRGDPRSGRAAGPRRRGRRGGLRGRVVPLRARQAPDRRPRPGRPGRPDGGHRGSRPGRARRPWSTC